MTTMQAEHSRSTMSQVDVQVEALDSHSIGSIQLPSGWESISHAQFVQFAVGQAHSPITPSKVFPALRYENTAGQQVFTPLSQILSYSTEKVVRQTR